MQKFSDHDLRKKLRRWNRYASGLFICSFILGATGVGLSLAIGVFAGDLGTVWTRRFAFTSAFTFSLLSILKLPNIPRSLRKAHNYLFTAMIRFDKEEISMSSLIDAYAKAEDMIILWDLHFDRSAPETSSNNHES